MTVFMVLYSILCSALVAVCEMAVSCWGQGWGPPISRFKPWPLYPSSWGMNLTRGDPPAWSWCDGWIVQYSYGYFSCCEEGAFIVISTHEMSWLLIHECDRVVRNQIFKNLPLESISCPFQQS